MQHNCNYCKSADRCSLPKQAHFCNGSTCPYFRVSLGNASSNLFGAGIGYGMLNVIGRKNVSYK